MCEQCLVDPFQFGEVLPGWTLIRARRKGNYMNVRDWGLVEHNNPTFIFEETPKINDDLDINEYFKIIEDFETTLMENSPDYNHSMFNAIHRLIESIKKARNGSIKQHMTDIEWLYLHIANYIHVVEVEVIPHHVNFGDNIPEDYYYDPVC